MATDQVILLDESTANRIAAGEVVERPSSAVKELVENAVDAGATRIAIGLREGGRAQIVVTDDGSGMTRADAILALQRHATSKIRSADDLSFVRTLGFRGEALPSIASVSLFTLVSKPPDQEAATRVACRYGEIEEVADGAAPDGTRVEVSDLFSNTPARLKFLKSVPAETARVVEAVGQLAIAYPSIAFSIQTESAEIFSTGGTGDALAALASVWGRETARRLTPVSSEVGDVRVSGYVGLPDVSRPGRSHELFFVNGRPIRSRILGHALEEAFRSLTPDARYPVAALFVELPPDRVDVNVHPTKSEVKFHREGEAHHAISEAVKSGLLQAGIVPLLRTSEPAPPLTLSSAAAPSAAPLFDWRADAGRIFGPNPVEPQPLPEGRWPAEQAATAALAPERPFADRLRNFQVLGQARSTYIVALTDDGLALIDQHVAHERVLYERLSQARMGHGVPVQRLMPPGTLSLDRREAILLAEHLEDFRAAGWDIEPFGKESFAVRGVPALLGGKPFEAILRDMVDELVNQSLSRRLLVRQHHITITNACKMAVKAGDPLTVSEMTALLEQLSDTENPYLCPHGRPIIVSISYHDLDRQFKRA